MSNRNEIPNWGPSLKREIEGLPAVQQIRGSSGCPTYLVGGAVRDLLRGVEPVDLDIAIDGPLAPVLEGVEGEVTSFPDFETASVSPPGGGRIDLARTRRESYVSPGSLPEVEPAPIEEDLARRDFSINAMAVPLDDAAVLIDPFGGREDLQRGVIRVLHQDSLSDDPTRAFRAARYAARLGLEVDEATSRQIEQVDLETISEDRLDSEIALCAREECASGSLTKAAEWGLVSLPSEGSSLLHDICNLLEREPWKSYLEALGMEGAIVLAAVPAAGKRTTDTGAIQSARRIAAEQPADPAAIATIARRCDPVSLILARALGASWLDAWPEELQATEISISGDDLLEAGVPAGPLIGIGLGAALAEKLNDPSTDRDGELESALEACRRAGWKEGPS